MDDVSFKLSRIYAEGWNAAMNWVPEDADLNAEYGSTANPYNSEPQRARWNDGFVGALKRLGWNT